MDTSDLGKISIPIMVNKHRWRAKSKITLEKETQGIKFVFASVLTCIEQSVITVLLSLLSTQLVFTG